jgi:predicted  nucleic acid-binding Zn-ribbon protein
MGGGSSCPPPWVDVENTDEEKKKLKIAEDAAKIEALEEENEVLKKRIKQLEDKLKKLEKLN